MLYMRQFDDGQRNQAGDHVLVLRRVHAATEGVPAPSAANSRTQKCVHGHRDFWKRLEHCFICRNQRRR